MDQQIFESKREPKICNPYMYSKLIFGNNVKAAIKLKVSVGVPSWWA